MGRKKKVVDSQDWAAELAGTPQEQWERAQDVICAAKEKWSAVKAECDKMEIEAENGADSIVGKAEDEADELLNKVRKEIAKKMSAAELEFCDVESQYDEIKRNAAKANKAEKEKRAKKETRLRIMREKIWTERDEAKAIKLFKKVQKLQQELNNDKQQLK